MTELSSEPAPVLATERLLLRGWREEDLEPFARLNADPLVMEYFPSTMTREESDTFVEHIVGHFAERGFGLWAVEAPGVAPFVGFVGLNAPTFEAHFTPCVEIGWRLDAPYWGKGYATEAAHAALTFGFDEAGLEEILSWTTPLNKPSVAVMKRLGMRHDGEFDHPRLPEGHRLRRHVLYRLERAGR